MPPTKIGRARALAPGVALDALVAPMPEAARRGEALKLARDGRSAVLGFELDGARFVVKTLALDSCKRRVQAWLRRTPLDLQARASARLRALGIPSAKALAMVTGRDAAGRLVRTLVSERVEGRTLLAWCREGSLPRALAIAAGARVAALSRLELDDRDLKPSNLIVHEVAAGLELVSIDPVGVRRRAARAARMLASLYIEPSGCGCAPSKWACARACRACARGTGADWRRLFGAASRLVREHGDPTPKDAA